MNKSFVQGAALAALKPIGAQGKEVRMAVIKHLTNPDAMTRLTAAEVLWSLDPGTQLVIYAVAIELKSENDSVRELAALTLGEFGPRAKAVLPLLREMMANDPDENCRSCAEIAIKQITGKPASP